MAHTSVPKNQCSAKGFSWVSALPPKEFSSIPNPYLHLGSPAIPPHGKLFASDEEKQSNKEIDPAVESGKAQSWISCFLPMGQDNRETSACHGAEPRTPNLLHPLVDKGIPHPYRKMHTEKDPVTQTAPTLAHRATKSQGLQDAAALLFHLSMQAGQQSTRTRSQGSSKAWEGEMGVQACSLA